MVVIFEKPKKFLVEKFTKAFLTFEKDRNKNESFFKFWIKMSNFCQAQPQVNFKSIFISIEAVMVLFPVDLATQPVTHPQEKFQLKRIDSLGIIQAYLYTTSKRRQEYFNFRNTNNFNASKHDFMNYNLITETNLSNDLIILSFWTKW